MKHKTSTSIDINASSQIIWEILMETKSYPEWNTFVRSVDSSFELGKIVTVSLTPPQGDEMVFKPEITTLKENETLKWKGKLWIKGLFDGEHCFELEEVSANETRFHHYENFSGLLVPFLKKALDTKTKNGFEQMNEVLKQRAEKIAKL